MDKEMLGIYGVSAMAVGASFAAGFAATYSDMGPTAKAALAIAPVPTTGLAYLVKSQTADHPDVGLAYVMFGAMTTGAVAVAEGLGALTGYIAKNV